MSLYFKESVSNLTECLDSLKAQTLLPSEVVIVIDGPVSSELLECVHSYTHVLNLKIIPLENNVGLGRALSIGIEKCNFDIVARMDTDDVCLPNRFESQIPIIVNDHELSLLGSDIIEFSPDGSERIKSLPQDCHAIFKYSKYKNPFNHMTVVFKKSRLDLVGGYAHHLFMEDYNLWLRMIDANMKVMNINDNLVRARVNSEMLLRRRGREYIISEWELLKLKGGLKKYNHFSKYISFLIRVIPRVLPPWMLNIIYNLDRK